MHDCPPRLAPACSKSTLATTTTYGMRMRIAVTEPGRRCVRDTKLTATLQKYRLAVRVFGLRIKVIGRQQAVKKPVRGHFCYLFCEKSYLSSLTQFPTECRNSTLGVKSSQQQTLRPVLVGLLGFRFTRSGVGHKYAFTVALGPNL